MTVVRAAGASATRTLLIIGLVVLALGLTVAGVVLPGPPYPDSSALLADDPLDLYFRVAFTLLVSGLAVVGALVSHRRPGHPIGWLFLAAGLLTAVSIFGGALDQLVGDSPPFAVVVFMWASAWSFTPAIGILVFVVPLLFPTGKLTSPRWRPLVGIIVVAFVLATAMTALRAGQVEGSPGVMNPFGIESLTGIFDVVDLGLTVTAPLALATVIGSLVIRYRAAGSVERQQLRWFFYPAVVAVVAFGLALSELQSDIGWTLGIGAIALVPPAIGVAILRHRLFEIDRIVTRTLTYALATSVLVGVYLAAVLLLQAVLAPLIGGSSPLIVAASTLLVAALARPILRRVQAGIDRRFNRERYDGEVTVRTLATRLRDVTDLNRIADALTEATASTLAPRTVSVWLLPRQTGR